MDDGGSVQVDSVLLSCGTQQHLTLCSWDGLIGSPGHFDHGYAVTSHSSQGLTSERVLVNMDKEVHPELINSRFAYVSVSRASHDAQIYTNKAATLAESLSNDVTKGIRD
jgi:hypothetical protein